MTRRATTTIGTTTATAMVPEEPKPLVTFAPDCKLAVDAPDADDDVDVPVFVGVSPPWVDVLKTVIVEPPGSVVVLTGVDIGVADVVGVGVGVGVGVSLCVVAGGGDVVLFSIIEVEGLGVLGGEVETGGGLLLAIELVDGSDVLVGDGEGVGVVGTPASVLVVELVAIVNCLLNTSFLGCLDAAMSAKRNIISWVYGNSQHIYQDEAHHTSSLAWIKTKLCSSDPVCLGGDCVSVEVSCLERASDVLLASFHWWADRCASLRAALRPFENEWAWMKRRRRPQPNASLYQECRRCNCKTSRWTMRAEGGGGGGVVEEKCWIRGDVPQ
jgi:hypothetical protein